MQVFPNLQIIYSWRAHVNLYTWSLILKSFLCPISRSSAKVDPCSLYLWHPQSPLWQDNSSFCIFPSLHFKQVARTLLPSYLQDGFYFWTKSQSFLQDTQLLDFWKAETHWFARCVGGLQLREDWVFEKLQKSRVEERWWVLHRSPRKSRDLHFAQLQRLRGWYGSKGRTRAEPCWRSQTSRRLCVRFCQSGLTVNRWWQGPPDALVPCGSLCLTPLLALSGFRHYPICHFDGTDIFTTELMTVTENGTLLSYTALRKVLPWALKLLVRPWV